MGSRLLPLALATAALLASAAGVEGLALWLGLLAVPAAAAAAFIAASDALDCRSMRLRAVTSGLSLAFIVLASAARENATVGAGTPKLATWALLAALVAYAIPAVAWILKPLRVPVAPRQARRRRRRPIEVEPVAPLERAA